MQGGGKRGIVARRRKRVPYADASRSRVRCHFDDRRRAAADDSIAIAAARRRFSPIESYAACENDPISSDPLIARRIQSYLLCQEFQRAKRLSFTGRHASDVTL